VDLERQLKDVLHDPAAFPGVGNSLRLRPYQRDVVRAVFKSVKEDLGLAFVVIFPRQSGKNEVQAQLEAFLLLVYSQLGGEIVKVSPTWKPQTHNAMRRLQRALERNWLTRFRWKAEAGYIYSLGQSRLVFLSGSPTANVVGATASTLLECDEAQDVQTAKWDKDFSPMAASTNATRVFWGTAWTSRTLLARELRAAKEAELQDGRRRVFMLTADDVAKEVPAYGQFVAEQVAKLGRNHPLVRTQFFSEEIDAEGGMFPPARRALMQGQHPRLESPLPGCLYALLLDVAGEDEGAVDQESGEVGLANQQRDSTALTVVEVDLSSLADELVQAPSYRVVNRYLWTGVKHTSLYGQIKALAEHWQARYLVVDATGVGAGLASFLDKALPNKVLPFIFSSKTKSDLGWGFLAVVETGRYKEYLADYEPLQVLYLQQLENCQSAVLDGPGRLMRWGVPDGTRDAATGELVHDDLILSAALCHVLDSQAWGLAQSAVVAGVDPLADFRDVY
jgi:hypothetical protein